MRKIRNKIKPLDFFLGALAKLGKATSNFVIVCLSLFFCTEQLVSHWTDFHEI
jgi:hypothetical protein